MILTYLTYTNDTCYLLKWHTLSAWMTYITYMSDIHYVHEVHTLPTWTTYIIYTMNHSTYIARQYVVLSGSCYSICSVDRNRQTHTEPSTYMQTCKRTYTHTCVYTVRTFVYFRGILFYSFLQFLCVNKLVHALVKMKGQTYVSAVIKVTNNWMTNSCSNSFLHISFKEMGISFQMICLWRDASEMWRLAVL